MRITKKNARRADRIKQEDERMAVLTVHALGEPCPAPVVKATRALQQMTEPGVVEVHVDNEAAVQNLGRMAAGRGLTVTNETLAEGHFVVRIEAGAAQAAEKPSGAPPAERNAAGGTVVAITSEAMGTGDDALGKTLMKGFLYALTQLPVLPETLLFYNGGAKIPIEGSASLEDLKALAAGGVEILTCGTCLSHYGLTERLAVGGVTNMYVIVEKLSNAAHILRP